MKIKHLIILILTFQLLIGCNEASENMPEEIVLTRSEQCILEVNNEMTFKILKELNNATKSEPSIKSNFIFSPQSLIWNLSMLANAADGETKDEIISVLGLDSDATISDLNEYCKKMKLAITSRSIAGKSYVSNLVAYNNINILREFKNTLNKYYNSEFMQGFTAEKINSWVLNNTDGMIKDFASYLDMTSKAILINSFIFQGYWSQPYEQSQIITDNFYNQDGSVSAIDFLKDDIGYINSSEKCHLLDKYFKNMLYKISFIIPSQGYNIDDIIEYLNADTWNSLCDRTNNMGLPLQYQTRIPKFDVENTLELAGILKNLGIRKALNNEGSFKNMTNDKVNFNSVIQSTKFKLDEKGGVAATTTAIGAMGSFASGSLFYVDEPFLFLITECSTNAILFAGCIKNL